jgi:transposase-like protein
MTQLETLLQNDPQVQQFALAVLNECDGMRDFAARCVEAMINSAMSAQADELCGAGYNERSEERVNSRNGYRTRGLETTVGDIGIEIPKLRHGTYYPEGVVEHWQRADNALVACVVEMYANGISTAKVERVAKQLGVGSMSKSQVSRLCAALDEEVAQLRESDLFGHVVRYVVTVNLIFANFTNPTHQSHQRSFANSTNAHSPFSASLRSLAGRSGRMSFIL